MRFVLFSAVIFTFCGGAQAAIDIGVSGCVIEYDFNLGDLVVDTSSGDDLTAVIVPDSNWVGSEPVLAPGVKGLCLDNTALPQQALSKIALHVGIEGVTNSPMQQELNNLGDYATITCWVNLDEDFTDWTHMMAWTGTGMNFQIAWTNSSSANRTFLRKDGSNSGPSTSHPPIVEPDEMNEWIFLAVTYDGSVGSGNNVGWYKGWVDADSVNRSNEQLYEWDFLESDDKVVFFNHDLSWGQRACSIKLDEFRIFDRILTPEEIESVRLFDLQAGSGSACGDVLHPSPSGMDFNGDCIVDIVDFAAFVQDWLKETPVP